MIMEKKDEDDEQASHIKGSNSRIATQNSKARPRWRLSQFSVGCSILGAV
jgi:hypothetical protein